MKKKYKKYNYGGGFSGTAAEDGQSYMRASEGMSTAASVANLVPGVGQIVGGILGIGSMLTANAAKKKNEKFQLAKAAAIDDLNSRHSNSVSGGYFRRGGDITVGDDAVQVKGMPSKMDANVRSVLGKKVRLNHNEIVHHEGPGKAHAFSSDPKMKHPLIDETFANIVKPILKGKDKAKQKLVKHPGSRQEENTIKFSKKVMQANKERQTEERNKKERKTPTQAYQGGGPIFGAYSANQVDSIMTSPGFYQYSDSLGLQGQSAKVTDYINQSYGKGTPFTNSTQAAQSAATPNYREDLVPAGTVDYRGDLTNVFTRQNDQTKSGYLDYINQLRKKIESGETIQTEPSDNIQLNLGQGRENFGIDTIPQVQPDTAPQFTVINQVYDENLNPIQKKAEEQSVTQETPIQQTTSVPLGQDQAVTSAPTIANPKVEARFKEEEEQAIQALEIASAVDKEAEELLALIQQPDYVPVMDGGPSFEITGKDFDPEPFDEQDDPNDLLDPYQAGSPGGSVPTQTFQGQQEMLNAGAKEGEFVVEEDVTDDGKTSKAEETGKISDGDGKFKPTAGDMVAIGSQVAALLMKANEVQKADKIAPYLDTEPTTRAVYRSDELLRRNQRSLSAASKRVSSGSANVDRSIRLGLYGEKLAADSKALMDIAHANEQATVTHEGARHQKEQFNVMRQEAARELQAMEDAGEFHQRQAVIDSAAATGQSVANMMNTNLENRYSLATLQSLSTRYNIDMDTLRRILNDPEYQGSYVKYRGNA